MDDYLGKILKVFTRYALFYKHSILLNVIFTFLNWYAVFLKIIL